MLPHYFFNHLLDLGSSSCQISVILIKLNFKFELLLVIKDYYHCLLYGGLNQSKFKKIMTEM